MPTSRKQYTPELKLKVVLESLQRDTTIETVKRKFDIHTTQINSWRKTFFSKVPDLAQAVFDTSKLPKSQVQSKVQPSSLKFGLNGLNLSTSAKSSQNGKSYEDLTKIIGELTIENQILKKALESLV